MSRLFSGAHGRHKSHKPMNKDNPAWVELKPKEIEKIILDLNKQGQTKSAIGRLLRDQHGVPSVKSALGKSLAQVLKEQKVSEAIPEDLLALIKKSVTLLKHRELNKKDQTAKLGYTLTVSKIRRLSKHYRKTGVLPSNWFYTAERAALLTK